MRARSGRLRCVCLCACIALTPLPWSVCTLLPSGLHLLLLLNAWSDTRPNIIDGGPRSSPPSCHIHCHCLPGAMPIVDAGERSPSVLRRSRRRPVEEATLVGDPPTPAPTAPALE